MNALKKKPYTGFTYFKKVQYTKEESCPPPTPRFSSIILDETLTLSTISWECIYDQMAFR